MNKNMTNINTPLFISFILLHYLIYLFAALICGIPLGPTGELKALHRPFHRQLQGAIMLLFAACRAKRGSSDSPSRCRELESIPCQPDH